MLRWRLLLGTASIGGLAGLCWLDAGAARPGAWLFPLAVLLTVLATGEVLRMFALRGLRPVAWVAYVANLLVIGSCAIPIYWPDRVADSPLGTLGWPLSALGLGVMLAFFGEMRRYEKPGGVIANVALVVFSFCYVGLMMSFVVLLRLIGGATDHVIPLLAMLTAVKMGDTGAYLVGRLIGRHKLAPVLSPGKTIEGAVGAVLFACWGTHLLFHLLRPETPLWIRLVFGGVLGVVGIFGDLSESLFKRDMGCKDSSTWLPGFGGVLDLLDSVLIAAPVAYLLWVGLVM